MSPPRKHHILPAFYLEGFTKTASRGGKLHVFDYEAGKRFVTSPRKASRVTDFYRIKDLGTEEHAIEKLMAAHEAVVAPYVRDVASGVVPSKRYIGETLALAALIAARSRRGRSQVEVAVASKLGMDLRSGVVTKEHWEKLRAAELRDGRPPHEVPPYEEARDRLLGGDWFPKAPKVLVVGLIPEGQDLMLKLLQQRSWELHITDSDANGGFICSDSPLVWGELSDAVDGRQPSLASAEIEVTFPVSRKTALVSYSRARDRSVDTTDECVGHINMRTLQFSMGFIFHGDDDFLLRRATGEIRRGSEYFSYVQDSYRRGMIRP